MSRTRISKEPLQRLDLRANSIEPLAGTVQRHMHALQFYGIRIPITGRVMIFAGGVPLRRNGSVIGAIGVSEGSGNKIKRSRQPALRLLSMTPSRPRFA
jgi:Haem-degrading